jgi:Tfp pilus assembly ATPase PilU
MYILYVYKYLWDDTFANFTKLNLNLYARKLGSSTCTMNKMTIKRKGPLRCTTVPSLVSPITFIHKHRKFISIERKVGLKEDLRK